MRDIINKGLTNEELLRGVKTAWDRGWRQARAPPLLRSASPSTPSTPPQG